MHIDRDGREVLPEAFEQFKQVCHTLEDHYRDMQDMEFTIEDRTSLYAPDQKWKENGEGSAEDCM